MEPREAGATGEEGERQGGRLGGTEGGEEDSCREREMQTAGDRAGREA